MPIQIKRDEQEMPDSLVSVSTYTTEEDADVESMIGAATQARHLLGGKHGEVVHAARTVIIAAKAAYQFKSPRWLTLFSNAMTAIERCPTEVRSRLKDELCVFHSQWHKRPRLT